MALYIVLLIVIGLGLAYVVWTIVNPSTPTHTTQVNSGYKPPSMAQSDRGDELFKRLMEAQGACPECEARPILKGDYLCGECRYGEGEA